MGIISREYARQGYSPKINVERNLSVLLSTDKFSFMICDPLGDLLFLRTYDLSEFRLPSQSFARFILDLINQDEQLKPRFERVKIGAVNKYSTLVPEDLYDPEQTLNYLKNLVEAPKSSTMLVEEVANIESKNIFALDGHLKEELERFFPSAQIFHGHTFLIEAYGKHAASLEGGQVYINVGHRNFQVFVFKSGKLQIANEYSFLSPSDFTYFVLLMYSQFNLNPDEDSLWVTGQLIDDSAIYKALYKYVRNINWMDLESFDVEANFIDHPTSYFDYDLFALHSCG